MEREIPIQDLSIFFSVLIATLSLRFKQNKSTGINVCFSDFHQEFQNEILLIKERFPNLIETFSETELCLRNELLQITFEKLKIVFEKVDDDFDDIISWSYQFLKKDLEKTAFKKVYTDKSKIENFDVLFTTQFFTDKYMVRYLVDKSLSYFSDDRINEFVIIDPASGGGNFLNYSFEKLYDRYHKEYPDLSSKEIVDNILNNSLLGYDLDNNLSKISSLSLFIKACSYSIPSKTTLIKIYGGVENDKMGFLNQNVLSNFIGGRNFNDEFDKICMEGKIKVFVTNPPFMGKRDMDVSLKDYLKFNYPESMSDLCVTFIQKLIQLMNKEDISGIVTQNNWMYLKTLKDFRKMFLKKQFLLECIDLGSKAFENINGEKTNVALCIFGNSKCKFSKFYNLKHKNFIEKRHFVSIQNIPEELTFELDQSRFLKNCDFEFNYHLEHGFENIHKLSRYNEFAHPMQGTSTGNNVEFVKYAWEVNGNPNWKLVSKGGGFSKWVGLNYYKVLWGKNADLIKANKGSALRNIDKIPNTQLVFSDTGTLGMNVRILKENQVFIASGPGIQVLKGDKYAHLAFLNSRVVTFLLKSINPKYTISAGYISKIPVAENILDSQLISMKSQQCLQLKEEYLKNKLPNIEFQHQDYSSIENINEFIENLIKDDLYNDYQRLLLESEIEIEIQNEYKFNFAELNEIKNIIGEPPIYNENKNENISIEELDFLFSANIDINCMSTSKAINDYSIGSENILERISYRLGANPKYIYGFIQKNISSLKITKSKYFKDLLHKMILNELKVNKIFSYKYQKVNLSQFVNNFKFNYVFLNCFDGISGLEQEIITILNNHHRISFFKKPLIIIENDSIIVGQKHDG